MCGGPHPEIILHTFLSTIQRRLDTRCFTALENVCFLPASFNSRLTIEIPTFCLDPHAITSCKASPLFRRASTPRFPVRGFASRYYTALKATLMYRTVSPRFSVALPRRMVSPRCRVAISCPRIASRCCTVLSATLMRRTASRRFWVALPHRKVSPRCCAALSRLRIASSHCRQIASPLLRRAFGDTKASYCRVAWFRRAVAPRYWCVSVRARNFIEITESQECGRQRGHTQRQR